MKWTCIIILCICSLCSGLVCAAETEDLDDIFICDLRKVFGTCKEYDARILDSEAEEFYRESCVRNILDENTGMYYNKPRCAIDKRVGGCINGNNYPGTSDNWKYDKYYYAGTSKNYPWKVEGFEWACGETGGKLRVE